MNKCGLSGLGCPGYYPAISYEHFAHADVVNILWLLSCYGFNGMIRKWENKTWSVSHYLSCSLLNHT